MYIEDLEKQIVKLLQGVKLGGKKAINTVKRYKGELERLEMLRTAAGNMPAVMLFTSAIADSDGLDQAPSEELDITVLLLTSSDPDKNNLHGLRRCIKSTLEGWHADGNLLMPLYSVRTDTLAITPDVSVYAMIFRCEIEVNL